MEIVDYENTMKDEIIDLLGAGNENYISKKTKLWEWQFINNPFVRNKSPFIVFMENRKIVGFNGSMPVLIKYKKKN